MQNAIGKTIVWIDDAAVNYKCIHFDDGSFLELSVETVHSGLGLQGIKTEYTEMSDEIVLVGE